MASKGNSDGAPAKKKISDQERQELMKQLDQQMESYLADLESKAKAGPGYTEGWTEENWEKEMESHPFFATNQLLTEQAAKGELSPLMQGLQDLKYSPEENTKEELAKNYKEDGNFQFKHKKYRLAVANYTEGLKCGSQDTMMNVVLLSNRAAAQFHLGNYRSSLNDCILAVKLKPDHVKALKRGTQCCQALKKWDDCAIWCTKLTTADPADKEAKELLEKAKSLAKVAERDSRRLKKKQRDQLKLLKTLKSRQFRLKDNPLGDLNDDQEILDQTDSILERLTPKLDAAFKHRVHFSSETTDDSLVWPVLFMYPEYNETDLIEEFEESNQSFDDHFQAMFGHGIERPVWDIQNKYVPEKLSVYFEDRVTVGPEEPKLVKLDPAQGLRQALDDRRYEIVEGLPSFIIMVDGSNFERAWLKKYELNIK